jgi:hypothetical protein
MPTWNAHSLAEPQTEPIDLGVGDTVKAGIDLPGVPAGTRGTIALANGFIWKRYWVRFDNGARLGSLDGHQLEVISRKKSKKK